MKPLTLPSRSVLCMVALWIASSGCEGGPRESAASSDGGPQETYAYAGCEPRTHGCPNDLTFYCALDTIKGRHDTCASSADCVLVGTGDCVGYTSCGTTAVNRNSLAAFEAEAGAEVKRYCTGASCRHAGSCTEVRDSVACLGGRCAAIPTDAGM